jgi:hypothetical protein
MRYNDPSVRLVVPQDGSPSYYLVNGEHGFEARLPDARYSIETVMDIVRLIKSADQSPQVIPFRGLL